MPSWHESPKPAPTYLLPGKTHEVHIFCAHSCDERTGPSRFSRNIVCRPCESVGRSKSSEDTLSTLNKMLFGRATLGKGSPPVYRTGNGRDGLLTNDM